MPRNGFRPGRKPIEGARAFVQWIQNPVSADGPHHILRSLALNFAPEIHRVVAAMREHPDGARLLRDKPDLGQALADMNTLSQMPEGSLGKVYHDFMSGDEIIPGYFIGGSVYRHGFLDSLTDWDPDARFLLARAGNTHDITHILAGYGTDFAGEVIVAVFSLAASGLVRRPLTDALAQVAAAATAPVVRPRPGVRIWSAVFGDAARRAEQLRRRVGSLINLYFEELLPLPLDEARRRCGIPAHDRRFARFVTANGFLDTSDWMTGRIGQRLATGYGNLDAVYAYVDKARQLIEAGVPLPVVLGAETPQIEQALAMFEQGATPDEITAQLSAA